MTTEFRYDTQFTLNKAHFTECFEQSVSHAENVKSYTKPFILLIIAVSLFFIPINIYVAYFFVGLGIIEILSIYFRKSWWVMRQMMSRVANHDVRLHLDDDGITIDSDFVQQKILWAEVSEISITEKGIIIYHNNTKNYISQNCLSLNAIQFITSKRKLISSK